MPDQPVNPLSSLQIDRERTPPNGALRRRRGGRLKYLIIALAVIAIAVLAAILLAPPTEVQVTSVTTMYSSDLSRVLVASGYVVAQRKAAVASKGTGRLVSLSVVEGDKVVEGQVIAQLESADIEAALRQAKANLELARSSLVQAKAEAQDATATHARSQALLKGGSISQADFDMSDARYKRAMAGITSAEATIRANEAGVRAAEVQLENTTIRAPFTGTVLTKNADVGEVVAPFGAASNSKGAVVTMADMRSLQVEADVSESNIEKIIPDHPCEITLDAFPEKRYRGVVDKIVPTADRAKATVMTKIRFLDLDSRVLPEMSAKVSFLSADAGRRKQDEKPKIVVNSAAVLTRSGKSVVYIVLDNALVERTVQIGERFETMVEIVSGLAPGEKVVVKPAADLKNGMRVTVGRN